MQLGPTATAFCGPQPHGAQPGAAPGLRGGAPRSSCAPAASWAPSVAVCGLPVLAAGVAANRRRRRGRDSGLRKLLRRVATIEEEKGTDADGNLDLYPDIPEPEELKQPGLADVGFSDFEEEAPPVQEPEEPCTCLSTDGDLALVRGGKGLFNLVKPGAICKFSSGAEAILLAWKESIGILAIRSGTPAEGEEVRATGQVMFTKASSLLCAGRILNPLGEPLDGRPAPPVPSTEMETFADYKGMEERTNQYQAFFTGVTGIDFCSPIGRGQTMLLQGTNEKKDKEFLWPDLMAVEKGPGAAPGPLASICVCRTMEEAEQLRATLEARGIWERCALIVAHAPGSGAVTLAMNAAMALAEQIQDESGEAMVLMDLEPMHRVWNALADKAGEERRAKGIMVDPEDEWTELEGTVLRESIAERRKFWFALISRAANAKGAGSATILAWLWEQAGGLDHRQQKALKMRVQQIRDLPRIDDATKDKMIWKIEKEAADAGVPVGDEIVEPDPSVPGVPNWEIEELKSITDGHVLLRPVSPGYDWSWHVDAYRSLARIGTDALHPALISVEAHKLRLKMLQGRDRANYLQDTMGAPGTIDDKASLELKFIELILEQPAGSPLTIQDEIMRLMLVANPDCKPLRAPGGCNVDTLNKLSDQLVQCIAGGKAIADVGEKNVVSEETQRLLTAEVEKLTA